MPVSSELGRRLAAIALLVALAGAPLAAAPLAAAPPALPLGRPAEESPALARAGGEVLRQADFEAALRKAGPGRYATPAERRALLEEMVRFRLLVARAKALGYDRDPEIVALVERTLVAKLLREELGESAPPPGEAEIAAFYAAHPAEFTRPERFELAIVQLAAPAAGDPALRQVAAARAAEALAAARQLPAGTLHFGPVAARYSDHRESRGFGGRYGWLEAGRLEAGAPSRLPAAVLAAASRLVPGEIAPPVEAADGFYLVRLMRREPARPLPLASVRDGIAARLTREANEARRAHLENELVAGAAITIDEALLAAVAAPLAPPPSPVPAPPPLPALPELSRSNSGPGDIP